MDKPPLDAAPAPNEGRLDSWKKIAVYLKRDITTVQRWEKREGMPVHRQRHDKMGSVYAFRTELDTWMHSRRDQPQPGGLEPAPGDSTAARQPGTILRLRARWGLMAIVAAAAVVAAAILWMEHSDYLWRNPIAAAAYQPVTGVDGELVNPSIRTLGFSPDGTLVTFWVRERSRPPGEDISIWAAPTLGGEPRPYLEGVAEAVWSPDGKQFAYHTPGPGDPLFVTEGKGLSRSPPILIAPSGLHAHFPIWAPNDLIYFVKGTLPDQLDVWRVGLKGEALERITSQPTHLTFPVLLDRRTLLYLATAPDGSGPEVYGMDVERRVPHRLTSGVEQYTSLAASANGHRLIATVSEAERTLWRVGITDTPESESSPVRITLTTGSGFAPRQAPNYLLYVAAAGTGESIWKISGATAVQLWAGGDARILGSPTTSADGRLIAFSVRQHDQTLLYAMEADGSRMRIVSDSLPLRGELAFAPDGLSITSAADDGVPHLFKIPLDGSTPTSLVHTYSVDPVWSPDGRFVIYSGPDIGTKFNVAAATAQGAAYPLPPLTLTRGARNLALLPGGRKLVFLQGDIRHKNLWTVDLETGAKQQLTHVPADFDVRDFDISTDGREAILERAQARSHVVAIDRPPS